LGIHDTEDHKTTPIFWNTACNPNKEKVKRAAVQNEKLNRSSSQEKDREIASPKKNDLDHIFSREHTNVP
jgi:hypothetical protein